MRLRKKPNLEARLERCARLIAADPQTLRGRWLSELPYGELHVELGCGKGAFTVETAKAHPEIFLTALEKSASVMVMAAERANAENLQNIRFINGLADNLAEYFAPGEVSRIYINFCDPWPTNRHAKRRLTHRRFLELYQQALRPGGELWFKTDNFALFEFSLGEFESCGWGLREEVRDLHKDGPVGVMTDYEQKFREQGLPIYSARLRI